jgi:hypothetical protein
MKLITLMIAGAALDIVTTGRGLLLGYSEATEWVAILAGNGTIYHFALVKFWAIGALIFLGQYLPKYSKVVYAIAALSGWGAGIRNLWIISQ